MRTRINLNYRTNGLHLIFNLAGRNQSCCAYRRSGAVHRPNNSSHVYCFRNYFINLFSCMLRCGPQWNESCASRSFCQNWTVCLINIIVVRRSIGVLLPHVRNSSKLTTMNAATFLPLIYGAAHFGVSSNLLVARNRGIYCARWKKRENKILFHVNRSCLRWTMFMLPISCASIFLIMFTLSCYDLTSFLRCYSLVYVSEIIQK